MDFSYYMSCFENYKPSLFKVICNCAPEVLQNPNVYSKESDVWSIGCIIYELFVGNTLFSADKYSHIYYYIQKLFNASNFSYQRLLPNGIEQSAIDLLSRCLVIDKSHRLTTDQLLNHQYFNEVSYMRDTICKVPDRPFKYGYILNFDDLDLKV